MLSCLIVDKGVDTAILLLLLLGPLDEVLILFNDVRGVGGGVVVGQRLQLRFQNMLHENCSR